MSRLPQTEQSLLRHLRAEKRQRIRNENASPYSRSGMSVTADGVVTLDGEIDITGLAKIIGRMLIQGNLDVTGPLTVGSTTDITGTTHIGGTLNVDAATSIGGTLGVTGTTTLGAPTTVSGSLTVTGPMTVGGTLSLPNGIINNAALASPVTSVAATPGTATGFSVGTTQATKASTTIAVPTGFSQALVVAIGSLTMADTAANRFDTRCGIAGAYGIALPNLANTVGSTSAAHSVNLTGLSGGTITLSVQALAAVATTNAANTAIVTGFAVFFR